jgi:hypothetical protein
MGAKKLEAYGQDVLRLLANSAPWAQAA